MHEICFCHSTGKCKTANKGGTSLQKGAPFPSLEDGEEGDVVWDPIKEIATGKEVLSYPSASPKTPFRFRVTSRSPLERSVSSEHQWDCSPTTKDWRQYCIQVRVMLGDGGGDQPPLLHEWKGGLITGILQEAWPAECITEAMVLSSGEAILFYGRWSKNEGLPYYRSRDIKFGLGGPVNWAWRSAQIKALRKTACRKVTAPSLRLWWRRRQRWQRVPWFPQEPLRGLPSLGENGSDGQSEWNPWHSNQTRVSQESGWSGWTKRGFRVKVNVPTFKNRKAKDAVTYYLWWDVPVLCHYGWDDCYLLPYVFRSLQGFLGDLVRSLGEDATLGNVLWTLDEHYGVVMTFDAWSKELYSLRMVMGENVAEFRVHLSHQVQILQMEYPGRIQQEHVKEVKGDHFYECISPEYWQMLAHKVDWENPVTYSELLLAGQKLERWAETRDPLFPKTTTAGSLNVIHSQSQGNLFPSRKLKGNCTFTAWCAAVEDNEMEEDSGPKHDEKETESPAEEDVGMTGEISDVNLSLGYIVWFANAVVLYQKRNCNCFGCGSPIT